MHTRFLDRRDAGRYLAQKLGNYTSQRDLLVLALPRGGVPVGAEVAKKLRSPLDILLVRKLGLPGYEELAMGAIASGGVRILNQEVIKANRINETTLEAVELIEKLELERREKLYREGRSALIARGKTVILVDDGIATGATMLAAIQAVKILGAGHIVVGTPTISPDTFREIQSVADEVVAVFIPFSFSAVGEWYQDFSQTTDEEVCRILRDSNELS